MQSGVCLNTWAVVSCNPLKIVEKLGKNATDEKEALDILKSTPAEDFIDMQLLMMQVSILADKKAFR